MFYKQLLLQLLSGGSYLEILILRLPGYIYILELILHLSDGLKKMSNINILVSMQVACHSPTKALAG